MKSRENSLPIELLIHAVEKTYNDYSGKLPDAPFMVPTFPVGIF